MGLVFMLPTSVTPGQQRPCGNKTAENEKAAHRLDAIGGLLSLCAPDLR